MNLSQLESLYIESSEIIDLAQLSGLTNLKDVHLSNAKIKDIASFNLFSSTLFSSTLLLEQLIKKEF